jgi:hypothetical protein
MARRIIDRIRAAVRDAAYDMTVHAVEEMAEDDLDLIDVETVIFNGTLIKTERDDPRGTRYTLTWNCRRRNDAGGHDWTLCRHRSLSDHHSLRGEGTMSRTTRFGYRCEYCEGTVREKRVEREAFKHKEGFVILVCDKCGNRYYLADTLKRVHAIATGTTPPDRKEPVPVAHAR